MRSKYLAVAWDISGRVHSISGEVESYIYLKNNNLALLDRVAELETKVQFYEHQLYLVDDTTKVGTLKIDSLHSYTYTYTSAQVVYNNISKIENYIQLNKGSNDGIEVDMGVLSAEGVVGVVMSVTPRYSLVITVLNPKFQLNCKIEDNNFFGSLVWDGKDAQYTYLQELPRHVEFKKGDRVVTSGYSSVFPKDLPVGTVESAQKQRNDNFNSLKIKLFTDFSTLTDVTIVKNMNKEEQQKLLKLVK